MHILLIHQAFVGPNEPGGTRHLEMARYLEKKGHKVTIISSQISYLTGKNNQDSSKFQWIKRIPISQKITNLQVYTYQALHKSFIHRLINFFSFMAASFISALRVKKVDLIWGTSPPIFQGVSAWLAARIKRTAFLFEVRDLWPSFAVAVGVLKNPLIIHMSEWLEKFLYSHADQVIVNSPGYLEHVRQRGAEGVKLIPNGVDPEMFTAPQDLSNERKELGFEGKFVVLYAGAHGMSNDLGVLIKAADLLKENPQILFVLVGDGKDKAKLKSEAETLNLNNVLFLPSVKKERMGVILSAADACVAILKPINMYKTTYPNKVFDYMASGTPVLLAIDGVIRKVIEDANSGLFIQPGNPKDLAQGIMNLYHDPELAKQMGKSGKDYVKKHFNRDNFSEEFCSLIEKMR